MTPHAISLALLLTAADPAWDRFRGPNGAGVSDAANLPSEIDVAKNLKWKLDLPPGFSSPVIAGDRLVVTAHEESNLFTIAVDRTSGKQLWKVAAPKSVEGKPKGPNSPVSPSPVTDGVNVFAFFPNFGLASYDEIGKERWRVPISPINNPYVAGASPVLYKDTLLMIVDQDTDSYLLAVGTADGKEKWRRARPGVTHSFSTPVIWEPKGAPAQVLISGSFRVTGYTIDKGEPVWSAGGMAWQAKSHPVIGGDTLYIHSWMADLNQLGVKTDPWDQVLAKADEDKDGKLTAKEGAALSKEVQQLFFLFDLNHDGFLDKDEWQMQRDRNNARNGLYAIKMTGAKGDVTETHVKWRYDKSLGNLPSPLLYKGVLYVLKEGGILTALNPEDGKVLKQGRVEGAVDSYAASPVAADGKMYLASSKGKVVVMEPGADWKVKQVHDLKEDLWATPALANGRIYIRTQAALYCFGS